MAKFIYIYGFLVTIIVSSCATLNSSVSINKTEFSDDLSSYLPSDPIDSAETEELEITTAAIVYDPKLDISARLDSTLALANAYQNENIHYIDGLTIQLYAGNDRAEAENVLVKVNRHFPHSNPKIIFDQPNYKVRMQEFYTQLDAYPVFKSVQAKFPKAILVPARIPVSKK